MLQPENVMNREVGLKSELFDRRLTLNLSGYWTTLNGLQANFSPTNGAHSFLANVGDLRARGVAADATIRADALTVTANGSYNDVDRPLR